MKRKTIAQPKISEYDVEAEKLKLRESASRLGLHIPEEFYQKIQPGDIIEIYSVAPENKQLYSNDEFKKICSYTEEQMATHPFPKLFWRSDEVHFQLMKRAEYVALKEDNVVPWALDKHELVESLHPRKRTFEMELGFIAPCFDAKTKDRRGWVSTIRVALIFEWPEEI
jgi:hypothetical protein